jgi:hypothetical protein
VGLDVCTSDRDLRGVERRKRTYTYTLAALRKGWIESATTITNLYSDVAYIFWCANATRPEKRTLDLGAAFSRRAELRNWLTHFDEDHVWPNVWFPDNPTDAEPPLLTPTPFLRPPWKSDNPAQCLTIVFEVDDFGDLRYTPFESTLDRPPTPGSRADWLHTTAEMAARCDKGQFGAAEWTRAVVISLINILSDVIAVGLHLARATRSFQTLILIERDWFLYHGSHPPKAQPQAFRGLHSLGMCSSPLPA